MVPHWFRDQRVAGRIRQRNLTNYGIWSHDSEPVSNEKDWKQFSKHCVSLVRGRPVVMHFKYVLWVVFQKIMSDWNAIIALNTTWAGNYHHTYNLVDLMPQGCLPMVCHSIRCVFNHFNSLKSLMDGTLEHLFKYWAWVPVSFWGSRCWFENFLFWPYSIPTKPFLEVNTYSLKKAMLDLS